MELELVNDLMKSRVAELESSEQKSRATIESLRSDLSQYQARENELYRKIDKLKDELVDTYKSYHSRSPSNSSRGSGEHEESPSKRRKVLVSDLVDEKTQSDETVPATTNSPLPSDTEIKTE
jgi:predicted  nucleic acid-binding Zn-ribbon protein